MHIGATFTFTDAVTRARREAKARRTIVRIYCGADDRFHLTTRTLSGQWPQTVYYEVQPTGSVVSVRHRATLRVIERIAA